MATAVTGGDSGDDDSTGNPGDGTSDEDGPFIGEMPDVVGMKAYDAYAAIMNESQSVYFNIYYLDDPEDRCVVDTQDPAPGTYLSGTMRVVLYANGGHAECGI